MVKILSTTNAVLLFFFLYLLTPVSHADDSLSSKALLTLSSLPIIISKAPAVIDSELDKLASQNIKLNKKQLQQLKDELLARFHPKELERQILLALQNNPKLDDESILAFQQSLQKASLEALLELPRSTLNQPPKQELLDYYQKVEQSPPQAHRLSLIQAFDALEHQSDWQAQLVHHIQKAILASLHHRVQDKIAKRYQVVSLDQQRESISAYNRVILLYAFRQTPSLDIVPYLDTLDKQANKSLIQALDLAYTDALDYRTEMALIVKP